ncbi:MAG: energy transducer TonB [Desulfuromonadaceae bacterium]|nr:energy transducer TonB [Desulfuromonadaceae bacterium]
MHKLPQATWFVISLILHVAVASCLIVMASHNAKHVPTTSIVMLDRLDLSGLSQHLAPGVEVRSFVRPVAAISTAKPVISKSEEVKPPQPRQMLCPAMLPGGTQNQFSERPKSPPELMTRDTNHPAPADSAPQPEKEMAAEGRPSTEKLQQHYLKEHFVYIRDLIIKQLVYPSMARRMNWGGRVVVTFTIAEDGGVHGIQVVESSGYSVLDKSALEAVRSAAPFPKPQVRSEIAVPVNFRMMQ